jgi:hypothetical protein
MTAATTFADPRPARAQLQVAALFQWARAGMAMARGLAAERGRDLIEAARALLRISQAVRLAIALAMRLSHTDNPAFQPTPGRARAARPAAREKAPDPIESDPIENEPAENDPAEKPEGEGQDGLRDREISDAAILRRPLIEIVEVICRNLGVVPDWSLWSDPDGTPSGSPAAQEPPTRPRPKPIPRPPRRHGPILQDVFLHRVLGKRLIWTGPTQQAPASARLRARLRCRASPPALDPIAPGRAVAPACLGGAPTASAKPPQPDSAEHSSPLVHPALAPLGL